MRGHWWARSNAWLIGVVEWHRGVFLADGANDGASRSRIRSANEVTDPTIWVQQGKGDEMLLGPQALTGEAAQQLFDYVPISSALVDCLLQV